MHKMSNKEVNDMSKMKDLVSGEVKTRCFDFLISLFAQKQAACIQTKK